MQSLFPILSFGIKIALSESMKEIKSLKNVKVGDTLIWKHIKYDEFVNKHKIEKIYKKVTVRFTTEEFIKTDFGTYDIKTGKNQFEACGCNRFCDCYGKVYLT